MRARATGNDLFTVQILPPGLSVDSIIPERHFEATLDTPAAARSGALVKAWNADSVRGSRCLEPREGRRSGASPFRRLTIRG
jgi:hypothetical protein